MGRVYTSLALNNPREPELKTIEVKALVDMESPHLCIPEHIVIQLRLEAMYEREVTIADGSKKICSYVGPIQIRFDGRGCFTGALVLGDQVLLGAVPMEDMDLVISPLTRTVEVNPESPNIPHAIVKGTLIS